MHNDFDSAVQLTSISEHCFAGATSPAYANVVGPYGGITSATLLNAALQHSQRQGEPIALTVNFAGPVADGEFEIEARPIRTNRSTQHWAMQLSRNGTVAATASAVLAKRRETWSVGEARMPQDMPSPLSLSRAPEAGRSAWVQRYDMRFVSGALPDAFDGQEQSQSSSLLWVRDDPPRPLDFVSLAAICDCFFPRIFIRRRALTPIGTVSLTCFIHADSAMLAAQADRYVLGNARALNFRNGYFDQSAEVWSDSGELLASTHQIVYYRE